MIWSLFVHVTVFTESPDKDKFLNNFILNIIHKNENTKNVNAKNIVHNAIKKYSVQVIFILGSIICTKFTTILPINCSLNSILNFIIV